MQIKVVAEPKAGIRSVLVIGSGPIIIGQAAEFDYSGTQACRTLKELGLRVILINNNPATIMTDPGVADVTYMEPLTVEYLQTVIAKERPDALLPTLGGQVGLNLAKELATLGILEEYGVQLLGTPLSAIEQAEDRMAFKAAMQRMGQPVPDSAIVHSTDEALQAAELIGYPVIVRPAYTLGGTGGGMASTALDLRVIAEQGLRYSPVHQLLIEKSIAGWKEIEFEVMRDSAGNVISVCNMENVDPVGIHTGDSIVVAPCLTLSDDELRMLRSAALEIVDHLQITGGCNVQFALHPTTQEYAVIEVNPRVSRSSALASKATGYPIAKVATMVSLGYRLDGMVNPATGNSACFEPAVDYVVVKIPRWPFDKFSTANRTLGSQMKATGEVMAIGHSFESALHKAIRSLELKLHDLWSERLANTSSNGLLRKLALRDDERLFVLAELLRRGSSVAELQQRTGIDSYFLEKIASLVRWEQVLAASELTPALLLQAKQLGFSNRTIARCHGCSETEVAALLQQHSIKPSFRMVDTCAQAFAGATPYYYSGYRQTNEAVPLTKDKVVVIGSGPIRIGQGVEFDYCSVRASLALQEAGIDSIVINNNPETVSTDFDISNRLYFEPLTWEDVLSVLELEQPQGVMVQFGGQTAVNLARQLEQAGYRILGSSAEAMDICEDRERFDQMLAELMISRPEGRTARSADQATALAQELGFPVLVRPSYVLGGRSMAIVENAADLRRYLQEATQVSPDHPILIDRYLRGREVEVDVISDGQDIVIPAIMEHIERAGVHSGDSIAVLPPLHLSEQQQAIIVDYCTRIARHLQLVGLMNLQFVVYDNQVFVLEVNPRASRTVPFLSKVTGIPMVTWATRVMLGERLRQLTPQTGLLQRAELVAVKMPVFSFNKLSEVETSLGPEMKSTGEAIGIGHTLTDALHKAFLGAGLTFPQWAKRWLRWPTKTNKKPCHCCVGCCKLAGSWQPPKAPPLSCGSTAAT
jgi:carbamoyl-phosphate synthase large subunit